MVAVSGACSFFLPTIVLQSWYYFDSITSGSYPVWQMPATMPALNRTSIFLNSLQVRIKVKINHHDIKESSLLITVPGRQQLGNMFHQLLVEKEGALTKIQSLDYRQQPFKWRFTLQKAWGGRALDPGLTLMDNDVKQNNTILAERVNPD